MFGPDQELHYLLMHTLYNCVAHHQCMRHDPKTRLTNKHPGICGQCSIHADRPESCTAICSVNYGIIELSAESIALRSFIEIISFISPTTHTSIQRTPETCGFARHRKLNKYVMLVIIEPINYMGKPSGNQLRSKATVGASK